MFHPQSTIARALATFLALLAFLAGGRPAGAAEGAKDAKVYLKNGDVITGKIVAVDHEAVTVETIFAGSVRVNREGIARFEPPIPARLTLKSGEVMKGEVTKLSKKSATLRQAQATQEITDEWLWRVDVQGYEAREWTGGLAAGLSFNDGNSDSLGYNLRGNLLRETYWSEFRLKGGYLFEEQNDVATTDKADADAHVSYFIRRPWYVLLRQRLEKDRIADVYFHSETGPGLGLRLFEEGPTRFDLEGGPGYQYTRFESGDREESITARLATFFRTTLLRSIKLEASGEFVQALKDKDDFIVRADLTLKFPLRNNLSFNLSAQERYDNTPAEGRERNDFTILSSLELSF